MKTMRGRLGWLAIPILIISITPSARAGGDAATLAVERLQAAAHRAGAAAPGGGRRLRHAPPPAIAGAAGEGTVYVLGLEPPWVKLPDAEGADFILLVPHSATGEAIAVAFGGHLLWLSGDGEPVVLPDPGLEPPFRLLLADVLPSPGDELVVAGGDGMVAGSLPPDSWTPLGPSAPGTIDALVTLPAEDGGGETLLIAAIDGDLWITVPGAAAWQPGDLPFPGQPDGILALAAPLKPYSVLLAWDGKTLSTLELAESDGGEEEIRWRPFPLQPSFAIDAMSAHPGMVLDAILYAVGDGGIYELGLQEAALGTGWAGPLAAAGEVRALTWWRDGDRPWLVVAEDGGRLRRAPLDQGPGAPFEDLAAPALGEIRGLTRRDGELVALDCCALHVLRGGVWQRLPDGEQPPFAATALGQLEGDLVVSDGRRIERLQAGGWTPLPAAAGFEVRDLDGFSVVGSPRDDLIAVADGGLWALDFDQGTPAWEAIGGLRLAAAGIAAGDELLDGNGGLALLVDQAAEQGKAGDLRFERLPAPELAAYRYDGEGHSPGAVLADLDGDGDPDLYLPQDGPNQLWRNAGGIFELVADGAGAADPRHSTGAVAADYDNDGDLDLYVTNFLEQPVHPTLDQLGEADEGRNTLLRNLLVETGQLAFADVTPQTAAPGAPGQPQLGVGFAVDPASGDELLARSLTATWGDYDRDGDLDLFVGNHAGSYDLIAGQRHVLYRNRGDGTFEDVTLAAGVPGGKLVPGVQHYGASQASVFADLDGDGWGDLYVTDKMGTPMGGEDPPDHLYRNRGDGTFEDWRDPHDPLFGLVTGGAMGIAPGDYDNDGDLDFYLTDGSLPDRLRRASGENDLYQNRLADGGSLRWQRLPEGAPAAFSWGTTFFDADLDGDLDLWVTTSAGWLDYLYKNQLQETGTAAFTDVAAGAGVALAGENRAVLTGDVDGDGRLDAVVVSRDQGVAVFRNVTPFAGRHYLRLKLRGQAVGARIHVAADLDGDGTVEAREQQLREIVAGGNTCASTAGLVAHFGLGQAQNAAVSVRLVDGRVLDLGQVAADQELEVDATTAGDCVPSATTMCLRDGRFRLELEWRNQRGESGRGSVAPAGTGDSGIFWFFQPDNWEMLVKVLDGCRSNGHRWVFAAATTNVAYTLRVTDTASGATWSYSNPLGRSSPAVTDTTAFACEP
ncbi:MAG: CRTAC1 family protein [Acidobacteria bacterium]|nr:MAG: CRTAC1 family protein [Acidobacteriota bacterium]